MFFLEPATLKTEQESIRRFPWGAVADAEEPKRRTFRKFTFRGVDLDQLLDLPTDKLVELFHARARRRYTAAVTLSLNLYDPNTNFPTNIAGDICENSIISGIGYPCFPERGSHKPAASVLQRHCMLVLIDALVTGSTVA
eukprot:1185945-Prorocentrum_minimum.AAC.7